jgi:tellurite resistance protein TerB
MLAERLPSTSIQAMWIIPIWIPSFDDSPPPGNPFTDMVMRARYARARKKWKETSTFPSKAEEAAEIAWTSIKPALKAERAIRRLGDSPKTDKHVQILEHHYQIATTRAREVRAMLKSARSVMRDSISPFAFFRLHRLKEADRRADIALQQITSAYGAVRELRQARHEALAAARRQVIRSRGRSVASSVKTVPTTLYQLLRSTIATAGGGRSFEDAAMAVCALVALSDGDLSPRERARIAELIDENVRLAGRDTDKLTRRFNDFCEAIQASPRGEARVRRAISCAKGNRESAVALMEIARAVARVEGVSAEDARVIRSISELIGFPELHLQWLQRT